MNKPKRALLSLFLALVGGSYFVAFSGLDVHPVLKEQLVLLPIQVGVLVYLLWWRRREQQE